MKKPRKILLIATALVTLVAVSFALLSALSHVSLYIDLGDQVRVSFKGSVPFRTTIEKPVQVAIDEQVEAGVFLDKTLRVPLKENLDIPLNIGLDVPIDSDLFVDQTIALSLNVPVETVLTQREIDLSRLEIPLNTEVFIDDVLDLDFTVPLDTEIKTVLGATVPVKGTLPIRTRVPIRQKVHIADTVQVGVKNLHAPLKMVVPIQVQVPLKQNIRVTGSIHVPIKQTITVPIDKKIDVPISDPFPVSVKLKGSFPARLNAELDSSITIDDTVPVKLGTLKIKSEALRIGYE